MKEKDTNKADREFLDVYLGETHPQEAEPSEQAVHTESALTPKRISAKMRRGTLEAYKQAFLVPVKLTDRRAVYLNRATQDRADFVVRRLGDRGANLLSRGAHRARPFGGLRRGDRGVAQAVIRVRRPVKKSPNDVHARHATAV